MKGNQGYLTYDELLRAMEGAAVGQSQGERERTKAEQLRLVQSIDRNGDGQVKPSPFKADLSPF